MATFPCLYGEASTGKVKQWTIHVYEDDGVGVISIEHGYEGGKLQSIQKVIREGKNLGKKNATTALQQAIQEARAQWLKKKESGYSERGSGPINGQEQEEEEEEDQEEKKGNGRGKGHDATVPSVMLAHDYHKRGKDIQFPCYVQPKLDGTRCVGIPQKGLFSRNKKSYPHLEHIRRELDRLPPSIILDGELYSDELTFQEIVGLVKSETLKDGDEEKHLKIKFHVYDVICSLPYQERKTNLNHLLRRGRFQNIVSVLTEVCHDVSMMKEKHAEYITQGYEGIMLRNMNGVYRGVRCVDLQKYKEFFDKEYEVVGFQEGQGLESGCVLWVCQTESGARFSCRPRGSREDRQQLFQNGEAYIGKMLTVRYQEETDDGLPRFPVGIVFRDYE